LAYECVNALRQLERTHIITRNAADAALAAIQRLGVELLDDPALHRRALELCRELGLSSAYDAHYLALAERTRTPLFTADGRLASKVGRRFADLHLVA
jgi:predicted nucleic acid-binding protein